MKKLMISILTLTALSAFPALAQNIGQLDSDKQPQKLKPAEEFVKYVNTPVTVAGNPEHSLASNHANLNRRSDCDDDFDDFGFGLGGYGLGGFGLGLGLGLWDLNLGWGLWPFAPSYFPYYSPFLYSGYGSGYGYGYGSYWAQSNDDQATAPATRTQNVTDRSVTPVVCFATDSANNWYANVDTAANAVKTQNAINHECLESGLNCTQSLGCTLAASADANHATR